MTMGKRINSIDIVRLLCAILVVAIHTQAIVWFKDLPNGSIQIITRIAVPFFFCTSGFFLEKSYQRKGIAAIAASLKKTIRIYITLSAVYFAVIFIQSPSLLHESKKWMLIDFLFHGSYYHLWYIVGVCYAFAAIYLIARLQLLRILFPLSVVLYAIGLLGTSYYGFGSHIPGLQILFDNGWFTTIRRIFLMGIPFVTLGWTIAEGRIKWRFSGKRLILATIVVALLFVAEIVVVTVSGVARSIVITIGLYPLMFVIFMCCLDYPNSAMTKEAAVCKETADFMYFYHPIVILLISKYIESRFLLFIAATALCLTLGYGYYLAKKGRSNEHLSNQ